MKSSAKFLAASVMMVSLAGCVETGESAAAASQTPATAAPAAAAPVDYSAAVGSYRMDWGRNRIGTYEIMSITAAGAQVTYSYGDESQSAVLPVRNGRIVGGGWFPTVALSSSGIASVSHNGSSASVSRS